MDENEDEIESHLVPLVEAYRHLADKISDNKVDQKTGPFLFATQVPRHAVLELHAKTDARKSGILWIESEGSRGWGSLFLQKDNSLKHEQTRMFLFTTIFLQLHVLFGAAYRKQVLALTGGLLEFPNRLQQVDFLLLERSLEVSYKYSKPAMIGQVIYLNEDIRKAVEDLPHLVNESGGAKFAFAIHVVGDGTFTVYCLARNGTVSAGPDKEIRLKWKEIFEEESVLELVGENDFTLDLGELQEHVNDPGWQ